MTTLELHDEEFGAIAVRCNPRAKRVILRLSHQGNILLTIPRRAHLPLAKKLLNDNRQQLRQERLTKNYSALVLQPGHLVGKHHQLVFQARPVAKATVKVTPDKIVVTYPWQSEITSPEVQAMLIPAVKKALRRQAEQYLPDRLAILSHHYQLPYHTLRLSSGQTRWGSCSSDNTISLNIWLMTLPDDLIDYVLCHELCHTQQHNHAPRFWQLVATHMPDYAARRKLLKEHHPQNTVA